MLSFFVSKYSLIFCMLFAISFFYTFSSHHVTHDFLGFYSYVKKRYRGIQNQNRPFGTRVAEDDTRKTGNLSPSFLFLFSICSAHRNSTFLLNLRGRVSGFILTDCN